MKRVAARLSCLLIFCTLNASSASLLERAAQTAKPATNPFQNDSQARLAGQKLFQRDCSGCHGENGQGNGRRHTPVLKTDSVRQANPGTLFWVLRNGSPNHRMPSFSHLPEEQRWQIITFLQRKDP
jgi:mono/diheme cytochrome c family protein